MENKMHEYLMEKALRLEKMLDTEWAEMHADQYDDFVEACEDAYDYGEITGRQFNELICIGLYDYDGELKPEFEPGDAAVLDGQFDVTVVSRAQGDDGEWWYEVTPVDFTPTAIPVREVPETALDRK